MTDIQDDNRLRGEARCLDRVAELFYEGHVFGRGDELELFDRRASCGEKVAVLDEPRRLDQVHRELDANRLERMLIGKVMLHQLVAVDERNGT